MHSPFPGMDPYLEDPSIWEDFHRSFITYLRDALLEHLPPQYDARIDQRVRLMEVPEQLVGNRLPDVAITRSQHLLPAVQASAAATSETLQAVALAMPMLQEQRDV